MAANLNYDVSRSLTIQKNGNLVPDERVDGSEMAIYRGYPGRVSRGGEDILMKVDLVPAGGAAVKL